MVRLALMVVFVGGAITPGFAGEVENIRIVRSTADAINARNLDALEHLVAHDVVRHSAATAGVAVTNLEEFRAFLRSDFAAVPDSIQTIELIFAIERSRVYRL